MATKLSLQLDNVNISWESTDECPTTNELLDAFVGLLVGHTYSIHSAENSMRDYLWEHDALKENDNSGDK